MTKWLFPLLSASYILSALNGMEVIFNLIETVILLYLITVLFFFWVRHSGGLRWNDWMLWSIMLFIVGVAISGIEMLAGVLILFAILWFLFRDENGVDDYEYDLANGPLIRIFYQQIGQNTIWLHSGLVIAYMVFFAWKLEALEGFNIF